MRRVVFVSQLFHPDTQSVSQLFFELFRRMAASAEVTVVCAHPAGKAGPAPRFERVDGMKIHRCGLRVDGKRNIVSRALSYASFTLGAAYRLLSLRRSDVILGVSNPPFMVLVLWALSKLGRFRYQHMVLDAYPDGLIALGLLRRGSLTARAWIALNRCAYRNAERVLVIGRDMIPRLCDGYDVDSQKIVYVPLWSVREPVESMPFEGNPMARELGLRGHFVLQYSGNMGLWHDMDGIVRAAERLRDDERIVFLMIGDGMRRSAAQRLARELQLNNMIWRDFVPIERLEESLTCCHVAMISLRDGLQGVAVPSKLYGIMAAGRPMLAQVPSESEIAMTVREADCGVVIEPGDIDRLVASIRALADQPELAARQGQNALAAYRSRYTVSHAVSVLRSLWEPPVGPKEPKK